jgi:Cro/C1-type HTH DNA-binding domain
VKIRSVTFNNRKKGFEVRTSRTAFWFPYAKLEIRPTSNDPVVQAIADAEIGREGFTYALASGKEGTVHIDQVLEYNQDPEYLRNQLLYRLTLEAQKRVARSRLSRREIIRRLGTSAAQFYRLLDQTNYRKSIDQLLSLLHILDCDVDLVVRAKSA